jgi:hypothetical protein
MKTTEEVNIYMYKSLLIINYNKGISIKIILPSKNKLIFSTLFQDLSLQNNLKRKMGCLLELSHLFHIVVSIKEKQ